MRYRVAVEDIESGHHVAWVLDLPGCFSAAQDQESAIVHAPSRITDYYAWIADHDPTIPRVYGPVEVEVVEVFEAYVSSESPDYLVNAFFEDDRRSLAYWDIVTGLKVLEWTRQDLVKVLSSLSSEQLREPIENGEMQTIAAIIEHIARAENWYLNHFDLAVEWSALPDGAIGKLETVRINTQSRLIELVGINQVVESCSEKWSARKILRRILWHEREHTQHIVRLATCFG